MNSEAEPAHGRWVPPVSLWTPALEGDTGERDGRREGGRREGRMDG